MHVARPHRQPLTAQASSLAGRTQTVVVARKAPSLRALGLGQSHATATATTTAGAGPTATSAGATDTAVDSAAHQKHNRPHDGCRTRDQWYCRLDHTTVNSAHPSVDGAGPTPAGCRGPHTTKAGHWIQRCDGIPCTRANGVYQHTAKSRTARCRRTRPAAGIYCRANTLGRIDGHAKYDVASGRTDHRGASANIADTSAKSTSDGCNWDDLAACKGCAHRCTTNCAGTGACVDGCGVGKTATRIGIARLIEPPMPTPSAIIAPTATYHTPVSTDSALSAVSGLSRVADSTPLVPVAAPAPMPTATLTASKKDASMSPGVEPVAQDAAHMPTDSLDRAVTPLPCTPMVQSEANHATDKDVLGAQLSGSDTTSDATVSADSIDQDAVKVECDPIHHAKRRRTDDDNDDDAMDQETDGNIMPILGDDHRAATAMPFATQIECEHARTPTPPPYDADPAPNPPTARGHKETTPRVAPSRRPTESTLLGCAIKSKIAVTEQQRRSTPS